MQLVGNYKKKMPFIQECLDGLKDTTPAVCCHYCGVVKKEFFCPITHRISIIDCECEREVKMYREYYSNYRQCELQRGASASIIYADLIDGRAQPKSKEEESIVKIGTDVKNYLQEMDFKKHRHLDQIKRAQDISLEK